MRLKNLSLKVTLTIDLTMSIVGALTFSSLVIMNLIQKSTAMMTSFFQVVMGVALVGRMVPSSMLLDIALIEFVTEFRTEGGVRVPPPHQKSRFRTKYYTWLIIVI